MFNRKRSLIVISYILIVMLTMVGCTSGESEVVDVVNEDMVTDVVVVGSGAAGMAAAISAVESGVQVIMLEKLAIVGGSTLLSGGIVYGAETPVQERAGVEDSAKDLAQYWIEMASGDVDAELINYIAEHSGETIGWLEDNGVIFSETLSSEGLDPALRGHVTKESRGFGLIKPLQKVAEDKGVEIMLNTRAIKLITDSDGNVVGIEAEENGEKFTISAKSVILATGGFDRNEELVVEYAPVAKGQIPYVACGNVGDGLIMAKDIGADIIAKNGVIGFRGIDEKKPYIDPLGGMAFAPALYVNENGERFTNEGTHYAVIHGDMMKDGGETFYSLFDGTGPIEVLELGVCDGYVFKAEGIEELAEQIGVPGHNLKSTVDRYNELVGKGNDEDFLKPAAALTSIEEGSFYALKVLPATLGTFGGPRINLKSEVLDTEGNVIQGLYAAGEVANGQLYNDIYPASGTSIQMSFTLGRVAGQNAAK